LNTASDILPKNSFFVNTFFILTEKIINYFTGGDYRF